MEIYFHSFQVILPLNQFQELLMFVCSCWRVMVILPTGITESSPLIFVYFLDTFSVLNNWFSVNLFRVSRQTETLGGYLWLGSNTSCTYEPFIWQEMSNVENVSIFTCKAPHGRDGHLFQWRLPWTRTSGLCLCQSRCDLFLVM